MFLIIRVLVALQVFCCPAFASLSYSPLGKYSDQWNNAYFLSANTAANAGFLNKEEILAIYVLNLARLSPRLFAATVIAPLARNGYTPELVSLIDRMNGISTLKVIYPLQKISKSATQQAANRSINPDAEISPDAGNDFLFSANNNDPVQLIVNLLLDSRDNLKTARNFCLGNYNYISISMQQTAGGYLSAIRFEIDAEEKKSIAVNTNKRFTTQWGGELNLWGSDLTDGYSLTKAGQEIFKDDETRAIEKLVIPWLMYYTNTYRKENKVDTLKYDACLLKAAIYQTDYLFNESKKSHQFKLVHNQNPESEWFTGKSPSDRALTAGCKMYCGENALYTTLSNMSADDFKNKKSLNLKAQKIARNMVYDQWHNSKGHRDNMLTAGYTCMGVSVAIGKNYMDDAYINNGGDKTILKDPNNISWIAFGIQVMAY